MSPRGRTTRAAMVLAAALALAAPLAACSGQTIDPPMPSSGSPSGGQGSATVPSGPVSPSPIGFHWDMSKGDAWRPFLSTVPGTSTYFEFQWCTVEPTPGARRWGQIDKAVAYAQSLHIAIGLKIRVGACWLSSTDAQFVRGKGSKTESFMPQDLGLYADFVRKVVKRYSPLGVHDYAIENEVNSPSYWGGSVADYEQLLRTAATAIHGASNTARVVDSGLSSTTYGYGIADRLLSSGDDAAAISAWNTYYAARLGTRGERIDQATSTSQLRDMLSMDQGRRNLAYLNLVSTLSREHVFDVRQIHFYEPPAAIPVLLTYLKATTDPSVPIEAWEVGIFDKGGADQAASADRTNTIVQSISLLLAGGVKRAIWLPLATNPDNKAGAEVRAGVLDPSGAERPAAATVRLLVDASRESTVSPPPSSAVTGADFVASDGSGSTLVLWSTTTSVHRLTLPAGSRVAALGEGGAAAAGSTQIGPSAVLVQTSGSPDQALRGLR